MLSDGICADFHKREEVFFRLGIIYKLQGKADASLEVSRRSHDSDAQE